MDAALMDDILARVADCVPRDDELLDCARWALADERRLERFRNGWPRDRLPVIGDYYCVSRLGQGASGVVYKALVLRGEPGFVALKLLQFASREAEERFREREVEILKALECPYAARYLDSGTSGGTKYVAMELVDGRPLDEYLAEQTHSLEEKLTLFQRVCSVVSGLHATGVVHRDLKPKHVLVDGGGQPWVVDFGLSAVRGEDWPTRVRRARTELGSILGTVKYMSPEQAWGGLLPVDHRADIWSLGVMLYEIATGGDYPYDVAPLGDMTGHDALLHRIQTEMPKKPRIAPSPYADALATLISRCLAHEAKRRIDSAETLGRDLDRCLARKSIQTRPLPLGYRLQRIAVGLAAHWRLGLWVSTVCAILVFLFAVSVVFGVRWEAAGEDYGKDTRGALAAATEAGGEQIVIVGISDSTLRVVPALADSNGIRGITQEITSWRGIHGRLMERFAWARPRAVVWDFYFRTPQPGDAEFVRGVLALRQAGVPVVLGVQRLRRNGQPELSPRLFEPIEDSVGHGLITARDMVDREGEFVLALRRGDDVHAALILSTFAAVVHPECRMMIDWQDLSKAVRLIYHARGGGDRPPAVDRVGLTTVFEALKPDRATRPGDILGCKAFTLERPEYWKRQTVPYERLLTASDEELTDLLAAKIVLFGDLRAARPFRKHDRHRVRYGTEIVDDVPGCYLMANALSGLLANRYLGAGGLPPKLGVRPDEDFLIRYAFVVVAVCAFLACLVPPKLAVSPGFGSRRVRAGILVFLSVGSVACTVVLVLAHSPFRGYAAMLGMAICAAMAVSFTIESVRNRYRVPAID